MSDQQKSKEQLINELTKLRRQVNQLQKVTTENPETVQQTLAEQTALLAASRAVSSSLDLNTVLNTLAQQMGEALKVTSVYIGDWSQKEGTSTILAEYISPQALPLEHISDLGVTYNYKKDFARSHDWLQKGKILISHIDSPDLPDEERTHMEKYGAISTLVVPFIAKDHVTGYVELWESRHKHEFTNQEITLCQAIAQQGAIAIEQARLYTEAHENEEKYQTLIEQSNDAIYLIYGNKFALINPKFEDLFGVTQEQVNAPDFVFTNIVAPKSRKLIIEQAKLERAAKQSGNLQKISPVYEFTALDKNGNEIEVELSVSYPTYKGHLATQGVLRDITERKRAEAAQAELQAQMFQSAKLASVGELAAGVAHEINNPIFGIREYADLILEDTSENDPNSAMLQTIIRESDRIAEIVHNLLEFARPSETSIHPVNLIDIWQPVYKLIGQSFKKHGIKLNVAIPNDLPPVRARGQQLQQVMLNLVTNAKDAIIEKYPTGQSSSQKCIAIKAGKVEGVSTFVLPNRNAPRQAIWFTVRDEGIGISPENRDALFNPFFTTKRARGGTGLGLSISHKIIEEHNGRIEVDSKPGEFTEFKVILPANT